MSRQRLAVSMPEVQGSAVEAFMSDPIPVEVTERTVRESIVIARTHGERFFDQIVWQVENEVWTVLGYESWDAMREVEYAGLGVVAPRSDRPELVSRLRAKGLTQANIAGTLGVSQSTVSSILNNSSDNDAAPATITNSRGQERPAAYVRGSVTVLDPASGELSDVPTVTTTTTRTVIDPQRAEPADVIERAVADVERAVARTVDLSIADLPADRAVDLARRVSVAATTLGAFRLLIEGQA